jgi:hypothetical protein
MGPGTFKKILNCPLICIGFLKFLSNPLVTLPIPFFFGRRLVLTSVADPDPFDTDPDPARHFDNDPDAQHCFQQ